MRASTFSRTTNRRRALPLAYWVILLSACGAGQQPAPAASAPAAKPAASAPVQEQKSLADIARGLRKDKTSEVQMSPEDAEKLFRSVDRILAFASEDSGLPRRASVQRRLVGASDVEKFTKEHIAKEEYSKRLERGELSMKKFGLLPRDFNLRDFIVKANGQQIAGYYDDETKTISLLNWIPLERQAPILAHELTHALQDQNYDLKNWIKAGGPHASANRKDEFALDDEESATARHAVIEGQAMVVLYDYLLAPFGRSLESTPGLVASMEDPVVTAIIDTPLMHSAPMVMRETGSFTYRNGLFFEAALLEKGGKHAAFSGALTHPPRSTHEILEPEAYLSGERLQPLPIADLRPLVAGTYELYDSGGFGELDIRTLLKQFGEKKAATELSPAWRGGAYVTFQRSGDPAHAAKPATTADVALIYISRWKTQEAVQKFAKLYEDGVYKRYKTVQGMARAVCAQCPFTTTRVTTEEGPVIIEQWPGNTLIISEGFDDRTASKLRDALLNPSAAQAADSQSWDELSLRLYSLPAFRELQAGFENRILEALEESARIHSSAVPH